MFIIDHKRKFEKKQNNEETALKQTKNDSIEQMNVKKY